MKDYDKSYGSVDDYARAKNYLVDVTVGIHHHCEMFRKYEKPQYAICDEEWNSLLSFAGKYYMQDNYHSIPFFKSYDGDFVK